MQYRTLGRTGIQVSPYALGTLMFATVMGNAPEDSARIIGKALDAGINLIDTADAYGDSEDVVGKALEGRRGRGRARHQVRPPDRAGPRPPGRLAAVDRHRRGELAATPADRLHRSLPASPPIPAPTSRKPSPR